MGSRQRAMHKDLRQERANDKAIKKLLRAHGIDADEVELVFVPGDPNNQPEPPQVFAVDLSGTEPTETIEMIPICGVSETIKNEGAIKATGCKLSRSDDGKEWETISEEHFK